MCVYGMGLVMASKYYIKLYHEILDDPKMMKLADRLFSLSIKLFLLAGDYEHDGYLPDVDDMAWRLRINQEELETDLADLASTGIIQMNSDRWYITKFAERQAPVEPTERWRQWKKRQRKEDYYQTDDNESTNEAQTKRLTDKIRIDKNIIDSDMDDIFSLWCELFPDKPKPKKSTKSYLAKLKTRNNDDYFVENWREAMARASQSPHLQESSWFNFAWFIKNDENWQKCYDRNFASWDDGYKDKSSVNKADIKIQSDGSINA